MESGPLTAVGVMSREGALAEVPRSQGTCPHWKHVPCGAQGGAATWGRPRPLGCRCPGLTAGLWFPFPPPPSGHLPLIWKLARTFVCLNCVVVSSVEYADGSNLYLACVAAELGVQACVCHTHVHSPWGSLWATAVHRYQAWHRWGFKTDG